MALTDQITMTTEEWETYLGEQFRTMRIRANLEQTQLATRSGVSLGACSATN